MLNMILCIQWHKSKLPYFKNYIAMISISECPICTEIKILGLKNDQIENKLHLKNHKKWKLDLLGSQKTIKIEIWSNQFVKALTYSRNTLSNCTFSPKNHF